MDSQPVNSARPTPASVSFAAAPAAIRARAREAALRVNRPVVIAICGPVGAGKSTLASQVQGAVLRTDDYLPDYHATPEHERDLPERADVARLLHDLAMLRAGRPARVPVWSFHSHQREGERDVQPHDAIVLEGIHALHEPIRPLVDLGVFVDAPAATRWARWEALETTGVRGWGVARARAYFDDVAEPSFLRLASIYRAAADLIVLNP